MSDATKTASPKKASKPKAAASHPTFFVMISKAIAETKSRKGASRPAILNYIEANYDVDKKSLPAQLRTQIRRLVEADMLIQNGQSFKVSEAGKAKLKAASKPKKATKAAGAAAAKPTAKKTGEKKTSTAKKAGTTAKKPSTTAKKVSTTAKTTGTTKKTGVKKTTKAAGAKKATGTKQAAGAKKTAAKKSGTKTSKK